MSEENPVVSGLSSCFWFWGLCSKIHSNFHIWDMRYEIMKGHRNWIHQNLRASAPKVCLPGGSPPLGEIWEPGDCWMSVLFPKAIPKKEKQWWSHQLSYTTHGPMPLKNVPHLCLNAGICFKLSSDERYSSCLIGHYQNGMAVIA